MSYIRPIQYFVNDHLFEFNFIPLAVLQEEKSLFAASLNLLACFADPFLWLYKK